MSALENGIVKKIEADPILGALIGSGADARLYPVVMDEGTKFPALVYQIIDTGRLPTMDGPANLTRQRVQFSAWATRYSSAKAIGDALRKIFEGFKGALPDGTIVQSSFLADMRPTFEAEPNLHRRDVDFDIWFEETI